ncbi:MAG: hypothetical protein ACR2JB_15930 [Bryobacteraceae bacterium]
MSREIEEPERHPFDDSRVPEEPRLEEVPPHRDRENLRERTALLISTSQRETLRDIGSFRMIAAEDLTRFRYGGNPTPMHQDIRPLINQGLLRRRDVWTARPREQLTVFVLTKAGRKALLREGATESGQEIYAGFVKPAEVHHDAAIYRMYQAEAVKIRQAGGQIRRVVLDYELKKNAYSPLAKARSLPATQYAKRQAEIARAYGLKVIRGHILLPDLRIEYETKGGDRTHLDLELATEHYRGSGMRSKAAAGFKMYAPKESVARLSAAFDPKLVARIFSL